MEISDFYCGSCFWFKQSSNVEEGECHLNPPNYYGLPTVKNNDYCSNHKRVGKIPPTLSEALREIDNY